MEETSLPAEMDYMNISGLRIEAREKLNLVKPANLGRGPYFWSFAGRYCGIDGVYEVAGYTGEREAM